MPGVVTTKVGFTGGTTKNVTYRTLGDHTESVVLEYDPEEITYGDLLKKFWSLHNPTVVRGSQYMSAIFYHNSKQKMEAEQSMNDHQKTISQPIVTKIKKAETFYDAEDYHQKYILRQHHEIFDSLNLSDKDLITSHVAARLNGYLGGYSTIEAFEEESEDLGLVPKVKSLVLKKLQHKL